MKTLIASTFALMIFTGSAFAAHTFVPNDADQFGTDRYWEQVSQGTQ